MAGIIQRFPAALLPMLSIKSTETPPSLGEQVMPGLEMAPFYLAERQEVVTLTQAAVTTATSVFLPVPAGEYWWLYNVSAIASAITVASNVQLAVGVADPAQQSYWGGMTAPVVAIAGQAFVVPALAPQPLLLRPGMRLFAATLVPPTQLDLTVRAIVARLTPN